MAAFCLTPEFVDKFKKGLVSHEIDPFKLADMSSAERRAFLEKWVGKENSKEVNALFESKLLLKNQILGVENWAKKVAGLTPEAKRDIMAKIAKMQDVLNPKTEQAFLEDLVNKRLKVDVTMDEAKSLADLSKKTEESKAVLEAKIKSETAKNPDYLNSKDYKNSSEKWDYGYNQVNLENYFNELKLESKKIKLRENPFQKGFDVIKGIPGFMKSVVASLDNSYFGRQGIKTLYTHPVIWSKLFLKSWSDLGRQVFAKGKWYKSGDDAVLDSIKADIYSRPNALNGKYKAGGYGLDVLSEEAYPSSLPEKIPVLGRLFKASETAYNGAALRMRADLADNLIAKAEKMGVNTLDPEQAKGIGTLVGGMTGRGSLPLTEGQSKLANVAFFSIKFLKSNVDTLTMHQFEGKSTAFSRREARVNLMKIVATQATILTVATLLNPNSTDTDPRSTNFGKIKVGNAWIDISGGMSSLVTLASRLVPTYHNGELGFWKKTSAGWTNLGTKYGAQTPLDVFESFFEGKLSPFAAILRDVWKRQTYAGEPVTFQTEAGNLLPLSPISSLKLMQSSKGAEALIPILSEELGGSTTPTTPFKKSWALQPTQAQKAFKDKVGNDKFNQANNDFNVAYGEWYSTIQENPTYKSLSDAGKDSLNTKAKDTIQAQVFRAYNFYYKTPKKTVQEKIEARTVKTLLPSKK